MINKFEAKFLWTISLMTLGIIIFLCLVSMACGVPTAALVNQPVILPSLGSAPVPQVGNEKDMVVCRTDAESGGLRVRPAAGDLTTYSRAFIEGDSVTVRIPATITEDMGMWYQLADGSGWVNARYLCEVEQ